MSDISIRNIDSIGHVNSEAWDALVHGASPFQSYAFLQALEDSGSVGPNTGWLPNYLVVEKEGKLLGGCVAYIKGDSYGEYIFDWAWARAAGHFSVPYYPKLTVAAPFTPATGHRLLVSSEADRELILRALGGGLVQMAKQLDLSGVHILFCTEEESLALGKMGFAERASYQFHWHNRGYENFDDFLAGLKSRKRKQIRRERRESRTQIDGIDFVSGKEMEAEDLQALDRFYRSTVHSRGGYDYLRPGFFENLAQNMPEMRFARAHLDGEIVAGALFFEGQGALYGRYWGCDEHCDFLHFEVAYYAGIEYCIENKLQLFEAGAQGEHKLLRGFMPAKTYSAHWLANADFDKAVRGFLRQEAMEVEGRCRDLASYGPFRSDSE